MTVSGRTTVSSFVQPLKVLSLIAVTPAGSSIRNKEEQPSNMLSGIVGALEDSVTSAKLEQPLNVLTPYFSTLAGITMLLSVVQP